VRRRRACRWLCGTGLTLQAAAALAAGNAAQPPATAAQWMPHELIVSLTDLPRAYSCDDLWYRFHDVLSAIGARDMRILTYDCSDAAAHAHGSPKVELKFQLPGALTGADTRFADLTANDSTVHFAPGSPRSLNGDDCELMKQMTDGLLGALGLHTDAKFRCAAAAPAARFAVTVRALLPAS
jgi:hypothetical protein